MSGVEKLLEKMLLAGIGTAVEVREQSEELLGRLAARGKEVLSQSGIRNELLHHGTSAEKNTAAQTSGMDVEALREKLAGMTEEQRQAIREILDTLEASAEDQAP